MTTKQPYSANTPPHSLRPHNVPSTDYPNTPPQPSLKVTGLLHQTVPAILYTRCQELTPQTSSRALRPPSAAPSRDKPRLSWLTAGPGPNSGRSRTRTRRRMSPMMLQTSCAPSRRIPVSNLSLSRSRQAGSATQKTSPLLPCLSHLRTSNRTRQSPNVLHLRECACSVAKFNSCTAGTKQLLSSAHNTIPWNTSPRNVQFPRGKYTALSVTATTQ